MIVYTARLPIQLIQLRMTPTLTKFPSSSHDIPIVLKDGELILHTKAPAYRNNL